MKAILDPCQGWRRVHINGWNLDYSGDPKIEQLHAIFEGLEFGLESFNKIDVTLASWNIGWAFIASGHGFVFAAVDAIRSYPVFYSLLRGICSNSAKLLFPSISDDQICQESLIEFAMSGYVSGGGTVAENLNQIQAGEYLLTFGVNDNRAVKRRYYSYSPIPLSGISNDEWIDRLSIVTNSVFQRLVDRAGGRQIVLPLSGGLDSRLIAVMLRRLNYDNVYTFSYGPKWNYEARIAKKVADKLGYKWDFIPITHSAYRDFFWSTDRKDYWRFTESYSSIPNMQDLYPLLCLKKKGLEENSIIVNGQSGDFISGGHVPKSIVGSQSRKHLTETIFERHYGLRKSFILNNYSTIGARIENSLKNIESDSGGKVSLEAAYESWEWQERQAKYVVSGQRIYDWLNLEWSLPLWDMEYLNFWSATPYDLKLGQKLYRQYLKKEDYFGLFDKFDPVVWRWPGATIAMIPFARLVGFFGGRAARQKVYDYGRYVGHYGPYYAPWGLRKFISESQDIRNALSFFIETWIEENHIHTNLHL